MTKLMKYCNNRCCLESCSEAATGRRLHLGPCRSPYSRRPVSATVVSRSPSNTNDFILLDTLQERPDSELLTHSHDTAVSYIRTHTTVFLSSNLRLRSLWPHVQTLTLMASSVFLAESKPSPPLIHPYYPPLPKYYHRTA